MSWEIIGPIIAISIGLIAGAVILTIFLVRKANREKQRRTRQIKLKKATIVKNNVKPLILKTSESAKVKSDVVDNDLFKNSKVESPEALVTSTPDNKLNVEPKKEVIADTPNDMENQNSKKNITIDDLSARDFIEIKKHLDVSFPANSQPANTQSLKSTQPANNSYSPYSNISFPQPGTNNSLGIGFKPRDNNMHTQSINLNTINRENNQPRANAPIYGNNAPNYNMNSQPNNMNSRPNNIQNPNNNYQNNFAQNNAQMTQNVNLNRIHEANLVHNQKIGYSEIIRDREVQEINNQIQMGVTKKTWFIDNGSPIFESIILFWTNDVGIPIQNISEKHLVIATENELRQELEFWRHLVFVNGQINYANYYEKAEEILRIKINTNSWV